VASNALHPGIVIFSDAGRHVVKGFESLMPIAEALLSPFVTSVADGTMTTLFASVNLTKEQEFRRVNGGVRGICTNSNLLARGRYKQILIDLLAKGKATLS